MMKEKTLIEKTGSFHDVLIESLHNTKKASAYLQVALDEYQEDGDMEAFLMALRNVAEAQGGLGKLARKVRIRREQLCRV